MNINKIVTSTLKDLSVPVSYICWNNNINKPKQYVTWIEINRKPAVMADDKEVIQGFYIQVDIWSKYGVSHSNLIEEIELKMLNNGFVKRTYGSDKYDSETQTVHKPLNFYYYMEKVGR